MCFLHAKTKRGVSILARNKFSNKLVFIANPRILAETKFRDIYSGPLGGGDFLSKLKNRKNLKKGREKGGKEEERKK